MQIANLICTGTMTTLKDHREISGLLGILFCIRCLKNIEV